MHGWIAWARGPAFVFCFSFMVLGLVRHVVLAMWELRRTMHRAGDRTLPVRGIARATLAWLLPARAAAREPLFVLTSVVFHVAIIVTPVCLAGHVALWAAATGLSWPVLSGRTADLLTLVAVAAAAGLALERLTARATRALNRPGDFGLLAALALPFASGFLVSHPQVNPAPYEAMLLLHVLSGNLIFLLLPTTKLVHAVLLPGAQLVSEAGWHWPQESGSRVGTALGKQAEGV